jgi:hypothetical protein
LFLADKFDTIVDDNGRPLLECRVGHLTVKVAAREANNDLQHTSTPTFVALDMPVTEALRRWERDRALGNGGRRRNEWQRRGVSTGPNIACRQLAKGGFHMQAAKGGQPLCLRSDGCVLVAVKGARSDHGLMPLTP